MALFGRRGGGMEVPPHDREVEGANSPPEEAIFRPKPEQALDVNSLVQKAEAGDSIDMVPELDEYYDGWLHYAQDRNVFIGNESIRELAQARRDAIRFAREGKYDELRAKLEELSGPLVANVEAAVELHVSNAQERKEATPKENKEALTEAVNNVVELRPNTMQLREASPEGLQDRHAERESRAADFAEKHGITAEREAMLIAEENYADAIRQRNEGFFKLKFRDDAATKGEREIYESAIQKWREALAKAGETTGSKLEKISANFISARDTMMRMEQTRQRAVAEGLDTRSKTTIGKIDAWANKLNAKLFSGARVASKGFGWASEKLGGLVVGRFLDKEEDEAKYKRASRIVGSAAIMTAIFAPFGAVTAGAAGVMFVTRTARGLLGWGLGSAAGAGTGKLYEAAYGTEESRRQEHEMNQAELVQALRTGKASALDQKLLKELYKKGSATQFSKSEREHEERKMRAEVAAASLVAGVSAYGLSHFPPVHEALTTHSAAVHPLSPHHVPTHAQAHISRAEAPHAAPHAAAHAPEAAPAVHIESVSVHGNVNDADKLFGRFVDTVKAEFPNVHDAPPALRTLMEQYHHVDGMHQEDVLTRMLHLQNGGSVVVHPGDTLSYENGKIIFQGHTLIDEHGTIHNLRVGHHVQIEHTHTEQPHAASSEQQEQAVPVEQAPTAPVPEQIPSPEHLTQSIPSPEPAPVDSSGPHIIPNDTVSIPAHEATPAPTEHPLPSNDNMPVPEPAPVPIEAAGPHIIPNDAVPAHDLSPSHPLPNNDHAPIEHAPNHNGFDLSKASVGVDSKGNLFSHIVRTGNLEKDNELSYETAIKYAAAHHDAVVYYVIESRTALGNPEYAVEAVKFNPDHSNWNYFPDLDDPYKMPPIPPDQDLRNIAA